MRHCLLLSFSRNFSSSSFILTFPLEIIVDLLAVMKIVQRSLLYFLTQFPSMFTSWITLIQYQNRETDLGRMCMNSSHFITCVNFCNHHYNQDAELFHHHKDLLLHTIYQFEWSMKTSPPFNSICPLLFII